MDDKNIETSKENAKNVVDGSMPSNPTDQTPPKKSNKTLFIILGLVFGFIVLIIILAVIVLAFVSSDGDSNNEVDSVQTTQETTATMQEPTETTTQALACLSQEDYRYFFFDKQVPSVTYDKTFSDSTFNAQASMFFEPDSIVETSLPSIYDDWAEFATENTDKQWTFQIRGSVYQPTSSTLADPGSVKLANDRANEVKRELESRGVPTSRINIAEPIESNETYTAGSQAEIYRRVEVIIDPTCS